MITSGDCGGPLPSLLYIRSGTSKRGGILSLSHNYAIERVLSHTLRGINLNYRSGAVAKGLLRKIFRGMLF